MVEPSRIPLITAPTPLHRLPRVSEDLGIDLWIKRDDLTGFALGGNKGRKLEYLLADAQQKGAEVVVTCGSAQSNFIRQLAVGCSMLGIKCAVVAMQLPYEGEPPAPDIAAKALKPKGGNLLIDKIVGAEIEVVPNGTWDELFERQEELVQRYKDDGFNVYSIPVGGSTALGAYAFYRASLELWRQAEPFDFVVSASSSGSTQTGLQYGYHKTPTRYIGVACDPEPELVHEFVILAGKLDELLEEDKGLTVKDFRFDLRFVGDGYGIPSDEGNRAIEYLARREGIFLDPIYSGKAFAGLMHMAKNGEVDGRVCFWHTGGTPALFV